jgi:arsenate reductase (thioredoxin)
VRPEAVAVLQEIGIDISGHRSKSVDQFAGHIFDYVLTICDDAKESCPVNPGHTNHLHRSFADPVFVRGAEDERMAVFRRVRDEIRNLLSEFTALAR